MLHFLKSPSLDVDPEGRVPENHVYFSHAALDAAQTMGFKSPRTVGISSETVG